MNDIEVFFTILTQMEEDKKSIQYSTQTESSYKKPFWTLPFHLRDELIKNGVMSPSGKIYCKKFCFSFWLKLDKFKLEDQAYEELSLAYLIKREMKS